MPSVHDIVLALSAYEHVQGAFSAHVFEHVSEGSALVFVLDAVNTAGLAVGAEQCVESLDLGLEVVSLDD